MTNSDRLRQMRESAAPRQWCSASEVVRAAKRHGKDARVSHGKPIPSRDLERDVKDKAYRDWMHSTFRVCLVAGKRSDSPCSAEMTLHHLRHITYPDGRIERTGRNDYRTLMLCQAHHQEGFGPQAYHKLGPEEWERYFGIDSEQEIRRYNELYLAAGGRIDLSR